MNLGHQLRFLSQKLHWFRIKQKVYLETPRARSVHLCLFCMFMSVLFTKVEFLEDVGEYGDFMRALGYKVSLFVPLWRFDRHRVC